MLAARSNWDLEDVSYKLMSFLDRNPNHPEALRLKTQIQQALRYEAQPAQWAAPSIAASGSHVKSSRTPLGGKIARIAAMGVVAFVLVGVATTALLLSRRPAVNPAVGNSAPAASEVDSKATTPMERTISYWGELQSYRNGKALGGPTRLTGGVAGETYFNRGDGIRLFVSNSDDGYLYMVNEEKRAGTAGSTYNILFPSPEGNNGSSEVKANQQVSTSELMFDEKVGTEKVWIVWSANQVRELEGAIRTWENSKDLGEIKDAPSLEFLRSLFERSRATKLQVAQDETNERMNVKGNGDILVYALKLKHR